MYFTSCNGLIAETPNRYHSEVLSQMMEPFRYGQSKKKTNIYTHAELTCHHEDTIQNKITVQIGINFGRNHKKNKKNSAFKFDTIIF